MGQLPQGKSDTAMWIYQHNGEVLKSKCATFGWQWSRAASRNARCAAGVVWEDPQDVLRSKRECRHSLRRGRFTLRPYSQGAGCQIRNVAGGGATVILMVKLMVKFWCLKKRPSRKKSRKVKALSRISGESYLQNPVSKKSSEIFRPDHRSAF